MSVVILVACPLWKWTNGSALICDSDSAEGGVDG